MKTNPINQTKKLLSDYARELNIRPTAFFGPSRKSDISIARQVAWAVLREHGEPSSYLQKIFSRSRLTIVRGIEHAEDLLSINDKWAMQCFKTCEKLVND